MQDSNPGDPDLPVLLRLAIQGTPDAVSAALHALFSGPNRLPLPPDSDGDAQIVLAEAMNNIVEHAYADRTGEIDVTLWAGDDRLMCRLVDNGAPMPCGVAQAAEAPAPLPARDSDLPEGGFGWHLIRTLARDIAYRRNAGRNHLTFCIPLNQSADQPAICS